MFKKPFLRKKSNTERKRRKKVTCHDILGCSIAISSHHASRNMRFVSLGAVFGKSEIGKLRIVVLEIKAKVLRIKKVNRSRSCKISTTYHI